MERLDKEIVNRGLIETRTKAKYLIINSKIRVNGKIITKPGYHVGPDDVIEILEKDKFVARSGHKLEKAIKEFSINLSGKVCLDIGASTGGFTECMLIYGARKVYAVDVGTDQLHPSLTQDERVINMEKTDARNLTKEIIPDAIDFFVADLSFISATKVLPAIKDLLNPEATGVLLIKPQFELSPQEVKRGIVKSPLLHIKAISAVLTDLEQDGFYCTDLTFSPIKGGSGNIEFLAHLTLKPETGTIPVETIKKVVNMAHKILNQ